jgi:hypothetical protein
MSGGAMNAAKIKEAIAALGGVPGTEHLQQPDTEPKEAVEAVEPQVNGWDEELVAEHAG